MFRTLREQAGLTQAEVADIVGRSPNYILKAEDLTFPTPPASLIEFYLNRDPSQDRDTLKSWYADEQRKTRELWLTDYEPHLLQSRNFRTSWISLSTLAPPTQYALSKGLCLPASVVYSLENRLNKKPPRVVIDALDQLIDYVRSGRFEQSVFFDSAQSNFVLSGLRSIKELLND